jgi:hypothetical protein
MTTVRKGFIVVLLLIVACCGQQSPTAPSGPITVSGRVLDFQTDVGLAGAAVEFSQEGPPAATTAEIVKGTAVSDASGAYSVVVPASGMYLARVNKVFIGTVQLVGSRAYRGDLLARVGTCVSRYDGDCRRHPLATFRRHH